MRIVHLTLFVTTVLLSGCATNLQAVRGFATETKKISIAFDPVLDATVARCEENVRQKRIFSSSNSINFDAKVVDTLGRDTCKPIADSNIKAKALSASLATYSDKLSEIAGDGIAASLEDDFDALSKKIIEFPNIPKEKVSAITALAKFVTQAIIQKEQKKAIEDALSHEDAVGVVADALVTYSNRVYLQYHKENESNLKEYEDGIQKGSSTLPPVVARQQLWLLYVDRQKLASVTRSATSFENSVKQMKLAMHDLRTNLNDLSSEDRKKEVQKLAKEVRTLYKNLNAAF